MFQRLWIYDSASIWRAWICVCTVYTRHQLSCTLSLNATNTFCSTHIVCITKNRADEKSKKNDLKDTFNYGNATAEMSDIFVKSGVHDVLKQKRKNYPSISWIIMHKCKRIFVIFFNCFAKRWFILFWLFCAHILHCR